MGLPLSCPLDDLDDADSRFEAILVRSIPFGGRDVRTPLRSVSFNGRDSVKAPSAEMDNNVCGGCVSSKTREVGDQLPRSDGLSENGHQSPLSDPKKHRYHAALKLQKVYKSFRTRRQLADCAVLVEQRWWKLLDFAELKQSSISFFDIGKPETAVSRWSRARTRAAKVGKGLSQDEKARKLALQHWLEAIDPRHRYGHNLQFYYVKWLQCESQQPFFYWLDIGEGKEVNLERCSRSKLQQQCIKYLSPAERKAYEVVVRHGKLLYKQSDEVLDTTTGPKDAKWIFVLSASKTLYVGLKSKGTFQHSSFLAGGAALSAGRLVVEDGILKAIWPHSGHYLPTEENFQEFISFLKEHNVDLTNVKKSPSEEERENPNEKANDICLQSNSSRTHLSEDTESVSENFVAQECSDTRNQDSNPKKSTKSSLSRLSREVSSKVARLEIPYHCDVFDNFKKEALRSGCHTQPPDSEDGYETAEDSLLSEEEFMVPKSNLFDEDQEEDEEQAIPKEKILQRIDSHKRMKSYQLAQQLSIRWATGAGPRIGCMRDYPSELQFRVLEQVNLSPRSTNVNASPRTISPYSPKVLTPTSCKEKIAGRSSLAFEQPMLSQPVTPYTN